ncbi:hypothetical protein GCM10022381_27590 [Leifsonia kafniensis]|uniref:WxL domain-containing protein n=1 Tax=Leifsonia kafniensis TaxID=475957 RepID=A0ABP7KQ08_9MICO
MFKNNLARCAAAGLVAVSLATVGATVANAAPLPTEGPVYVYDAGTADLIPTAGHVFDWNDDIVGSLSATDMAAPFHCSPDATDSYTFIAPQGQELTRSAWQAYTTSGFMAPGSKDVLAYTISPYQQINGNQGVVKAGGGKWSIGLACMKDNGVNYAASGAWWVPVTVEAITGKFTVDPEGPIVDGSPATIDLEATTVASTPDVDGPLSLNVPAGAKATLGTATLVNGMSTSTGKLGQFTVTDERALSKQGWTLTSSVADFVSGANTIDKKQLGIKPIVVSGAAAAASEQVAGSAAASAPFAELAAAAAVGTTTLDADLTFVAPKDSVVGTYTSKLTLTLASK